MLEQIDKLFTYIKLPIKYFWVLGIFAAFILFLPKDFIKTIGLDYFSNKYKAWLAILFILSISKVIVELGHLIWQNYANKRLSLKREAELNEARANKEAELKKNKEAKIEALVESLYGLDPKEKSVLREFYLQNCNTLKLPYDNATISGLINRGILVLDGQTYEKSLAGLLMSIKINDLIKSHITFELINLPTSEKASEKEMDWLIKNRPDFMSEIDRHNELFHKSWNRRSF